MFNARLRTDVMVITSLPHRVGLSGSLNLG
jgi:hypothetical protein